MAFDVVHIDRFDGGLDLVSSLSTIGPTFTPNARNFRCNDRGGIDKVTGYSAFATLGANAHELTYYEQRDGSPKCLVAAEPTAWQTVASDGTVANIRTGMTTCSETTFVQHEDVLYGLDRSNWMATWDGTTLTQRTRTTDDAPKKGIILGIWQNRMWVSPGTSMRVEFSDPEVFYGAGSWTADQYVELGGPGTSDYIVGGMPTADGLLVFTSRSTYLIYDDTTGANRLVDAEIGCSSRKSLARVGDVIYGVCRDGVFATRGLDIQIVSDRISPLFEKAGPDLSQSAGLSWFGSYWSSMALEAATNDVSLELVPQAGSFMAIDYPAYGWASGPLSGADDEAFFIDASDRTKVRKGFDGGSFAGTDIACWYETSLNPLSDEVHFKRLRRTRIIGRGDLTVAVRCDYSTTDLDTDAMEFPSSGSTPWNASTWDDSEWAGYQLFEGWAHISAIGRRFSLRISETSSDTSPPRSVLGEGLTSSIGGAGLDLVECHFSRTSKRRQL